MYASVYATLYYIVDRGRGVATYPQGKKALRGDVDCPGRPRRPTTASEKNSNPVPNPPPCRPTQVSLFRGTIAAPTFHILLYFTLHHELPAFGTPRSFHHHLHRWQRSMSSLFLSFVPKTHTLTKRGAWNPVRRPLHRSRQSFRTPHP